MLLILAASEYHDMQKLCSYDIRELGPHLKMKLGDMQRYAIERSPSFQRCMDFIQQIGVHLHQNYQ